MLRIVTCQLIFLFLAATQIAPWMKINLIFSSELKVRITNHKLPVKKTDDTFLNLCNALISTEIDKPKCS